MAENDDEKRDEVLRRLLKTPPNPKKSPGHKEDESKTPMAATQSARAREDTNTRKKKG